MDVENLEVKIGFPMAKELASKGELIVVRSLLERGYHAFIKGVYKEMGLGKMDE